MESSAKNALIEDTIELAEKWLNRANRLMTAEERTIQRQLERLLNNPDDKIIMTKMIDQSFRSSNDKRVADQINEIFKQHGVPDFFTSRDKILMRLFLGIGRHFPHVSVPKVVEKMREDSSRSVIPGEPGLLNAYLERRRREGVTININHLGEAVLGESEALSRLETYLSDLKNPAIEYVSVKISTIYSQISSLAFEHTVSELVKRLSRLYRAARDNDFLRRDGTRVPKFVNLDMEEYRDLEITVAAFTRCLDQDEFQMLRAGIVLQAYLPDSFKMQKTLTRWAAERVDRGGAPIRIRIVKGANMEMEQVEAALRNWPLAPYDNKLEVDANYKRMVDFGMRPENIRAANLGIASHNLFELAFACQVGRRNQVLDQMAFEMLEGMADHVRRAIQETSRDMILYAPVATHDQFLSAIAYLLRRLDENTAEENYLRHACNLRTSTPTWSFLKDQFVSSCREKDNAGIHPHRTQDRNTELFPAGRGTYERAEFTNEPDTDLSLQANRIWAERIRERWMRTEADTPLDIPVVVGGKEIFEGLTNGWQMDLNQFDTDTGRWLAIARYAKAGPREIDRAVATAKADPDRWREKTVVERHAVLSRVAGELRKARGDLIGVSMANTGKIFSEADPEVSEAVDFAEYYPHSARLFDRFENVRSAGKGVGLVVSPWNFPIAIPCGGIVAALAAGNTVLFKPASAAVMTGWELCKVFWRAGISHNTLQFVPGDGAVTGNGLMRHPDVDFIILTGGTDTGMRMLNQRPDASLSAETGGKNTTIVTAMSDREQAVSNVLQSAFGHCGQKCSATSLLILEEEVYRDAHFKRTLVSAAQSLNVGSAWEFQSRLGPMAHLPGPDLKKALTRLEPGESWALKPRQLAGNPRLWTPGIKYGIQPGSFTHQTEFFGPVLGVMRAGSLDEAIEHANGTGYGLTAGLESLDVREQERWKTHIKAGNLYINRGTTGAVVLRQPFGGMGKSALGPGIKAGGPNYVSQFMNFSETGPPTVDAIDRETGLLRLMQEWELKLSGGQLVEHRLDLEKTIRAVKSYLYHAEREFTAEKDYFLLRGQDNIVRYLPLGSIVVRIHEQDSLFDTLARIAAVSIAKSRLVISAPPGLDNAVLRFLSGPNGKRLRAGAPIDRQNDRQLIESIPHVDRIRYAAPDRVPNSVYAAAARAGFYIARRRVLMEGRIELTTVFREQSISNSYHRYGNLGERAPK